MKVYHYTVRHEGRRATVRAFYNRSSREWIAFPVATTGSTYALGPARSSRDRYRLLCALGQAAFFRDLYPEPLPALQPHPGSERVRKAKVFTEAFKAEAQQLQATGDTSFCVPVALGLILGVPAQKVDATLRSAGIRRHRKGVHPSHYHRWLQALGCDLRHLSALQLVSIRTAVTAEKYLTSGRFLVSFRGHVGAVIDGELHDWTRGSRRKVVGVVEVRCPAALPIHLTT